VVRAMDLQPTGD